MASLLSLALARVASHNFDACDLGRGSGLVRFVDLLFGLVDDKIVLGCFRLEASGARRAGVTAAGATSDAITTVGTTNAEVEVDVEVEVEVTGVTTAGVTSAAVTSVGATNVGFED